MRGALVSRLTVVASFVACALSAQEKPAPVARIFITTARPGMEAQLEAGRKKHMEFHKKVKDAWTWHTWQVETGPAAGAYVTGTFDHHFKDFDDWDAKNGEADGADVNATMGPSIGGSTNAFYVYLPDVSRPEGTAGPAPMAELIHFQLKPGSENEFTNAIRKMHEAIGKTSWPVNYYWYALVDGGEGPAYTLAVPMKGFADLAPPETPFDAMLEKGLGRQEATSTMKVFDATLRSSRSEILRYRADLSYLPAK